MDKSRFEEFVKESHGKYRIVQTIDDKGKGEMIVYTIDELHMIFQQYFITGDRLHWQLGWSYNMISGIATSLDGFPLSIGEPSLAKIILSDIKNHEQKTTQTI